jgi:hypothetical protein
MRFICKSLVLNLRHHHFLMRQPNKQTTRPVSAHGIALRFAATAECVLANTWLRYIGDIRKGYVS